MDQDIVNFIVGALVVAVTAGIAGITGSQARRNLTGEKKSIVKFSLWALLAAMHGFTAIAICVGALGGTIVSDFPLNLESIYDPFIRGWGHKAAEVWNYAVDHIRG